MVKIALILISIVHKKFKVRVIGKINEFAERVETWGTSGNIVSLTWFNFIKVLVGE